MPSYRLTQKAENDILHVYAEGIQAFGIGQARRYHAELENTFELLAAQPQLGR